MSDSDSVKGKKIKVSTSSALPSSSSVSASVSVSSSASSKINTSSTSYWTVSKGTANRTGYSCRECKNLITIGSDIYVRDGRKMRFFYHADCFSMDADPRTQSSSTFNAAKDRYGQVFSEVAPAVKGKGKWSTRNYGYNPK